ncbi:MAG TPA: 50S ribosomal protein L29 [Clostridiales bacterium]|nr:50S ribosomal protein L29 [Clostridiales bacterium]
MKITEIRGLSAADLEKKYKELKEELFNLRFQHSINQLDNPHKISDTKKDIARVLTVLTEKKNAAQTADKKNA